MGPAGPADQPGPDAWLDGEQARAAAAAGGPPPPSARVGSRVLEPAPVSLWRAVAGAAVAVAGVVLGIGAVLTLTDEPDEGLGPVVAQPTLTGTAATTAPVSTAPATPATTPVSARPSPSRAVTASPPPTRRPTPRPTPAQTTTPPPAPEPAPMLAVTVLNNSRITGLADRTARRLADAGWPVRQVGNFTGTIRTTTVYYLAGQEAAARRLAAEFDVPRVLPRFARLPGSGLTLVVTRDFA